MAIRLVRDGGLILIRGGPDPPKKQERSNRSVWLVMALAVLVLAVVFASPLVSGWAAVSHAVRGFLTALW